MPAKVRLIRTEPPSIISQEKLRIYREMQQKRRELDLLSASMAAEILDALRKGAPVEPGPLSARLRKEDRPHGRSLRLTIA